MQKERKKDRKTERQTDIQTCFSKFDKLFAHTIFQTHSIVRKTFQVDNSDLVSLQGNDAGLDPDTEQESIL
jgi:hypothetical protein